MTIKPGAYPWGNHETPGARRTSLLDLRPCVVQRLVTQMYFPGDPLLAYDPIFNWCATRRPASCSSPGSTSRRRSPNGRSRTTGTSSSAAAGTARRRRRTDSDAPEDRLADVGPYYTLGLCRRPENELADRNDTGALQLIGQLYDGQGAPISDGLIEIWDAAGERWGRSGTDSDGRFSFVVTKPDAIAGQAPRLDVFVFAAGCCGTS